MQWKEFAAWRIKKTSIKDPTHKKKTITLTKNTPIILQH